MRFFFNKIGMIGIRIYQNQIHASVFKKKLNSTSIWHRKKHKNNNSCLNTNGKSSWWFQPIWKYARQIGSFPQAGMNIKDIWNHHLEIA